MLLREVCKLAGPSDESDEGTSDAPSASDTSIDETLLLQEYWTLQHIVKLRHVVLHSSDVGLASDAI